MSTTPSEVTGKTAGEAGDENAVLSKVQFPPEQLAAESRTIAKDAYVYAYPLLLMNAFMRQGTNYAEATGLVTQAPFNQFSHAKAFPPADYKAVVRPNVDTLYSAANLDLGPEPVVLSVPATDRYFMLPLLSMWTDVFAVPGTRTTGRNTARNFLLVAPNWKGEAPSGLEVIRCPTRFVGMGGRTQTNGIADYENVHKIQAGYKLTPLSAWGKGDYVPPKAQVELHSVSLTLWDRGRTERRHVIATGFVWIGKEANQVGESGEADPVWSAVEEFIAT